MLIYALDTLCRYKARREFERLYYTVAFPFYV